MQLLVVDDSMCSLIVFAGSRRRVEQRARTHPPRRSRDGGRSVLPGTVRAWPSRAGRLPVLFDVGRLAVPRGRAHQPSRRPAIAGVVINARDITESEHLLRRFGPSGRANHALIHATDEASRCSRHLPDDRLGGRLPAGLGRLREHDDASTSCRCLGGVRPACIDDSTSRGRTTRPARGPIGSAIRTGTVQTPRATSTARSRPTAAGPRRAARIHGVRPAAGGRRRGHRRSRDLLRRRPTPSVRRRSSCSAS